MATPKPESKPEQAPEPSAEAPVRSPKPGAGQEPRTSKDVIADEAARQKASSSTDRRKRVHRQSSARTEEAVEPDQPDRED